MPSKIVTANTAAQQIAARRRNARHIIDSLIIDNKGGAAPRTIRIQDIFTPDVSNGVAAPVQQTVERLRWDTLMGAVDSLNKNDLKGVECLGSINIIADAIDAGCYITVGWHPE